MRSYSAHRTRLFAFTLPELLVVIGVIALLLAILLPALTGAKQTAQMAKSQSNMKQIATWMRLYATENREYILPSQFDYTASATSGYFVKVRSDAALGTNRYKGTWTDILWTINGLGETAGAGASVPAQYEFDSPDKAIFDTNPTYDDNVFRSAASNSRDFYNGTGVEGAKPFGDGAAEAGLPGFFAANNFFNSTLNNNTNWFVTGQIKAPDRSMYLVDSIAGETIEPDPVPFDNDPPSAAGTCEVDFRYTGACLVLFMDGSIAPQTGWLDLNDLQQQRRIKVQNLDKN